MDVRRRVLGAISAPFEFSDDDDMSAAEANSVCALGQVLSGGVFGFLFGIVGFVMAGEATRSLWWLAFMTAGAALGTYAARSTGMPPGEECQWCGEGASCARQQRHAIHRLQPTTSACGTCPRCAPVQSLVPRCSPCASPSRPSTRRSGQPSWPRARGPPQARSALRRGARVPRRGAVDWLRSSALLPWPSRAARAEKG